MCVAVPARIDWIGEAGDATIPARVQSAVGSSEVDLVMVPTARVGDYVVTHSGYAIRLLGADEAETTMRLLNGRS